MAKHTIATLLAALQLAAGQGSDLRALYPGGSPTSKKATTFGNVIGWGTPDGIERYYGIPIGESTAELNRFKPAVERAPYASDVDAFVEKRCINYPGAGDPFATEDCISVDIVTASNLTGAPSACWLHGGGFVAIDYGTPYTRTTGFWPKDGVIQVALHYRLGIFGFGYFQEDVDNGAEYSGNMGLTDAILELEWLYENIAEFGGDAEKLNVFGESGGAAFTTVLLAYPQLDTLVQGVAIQSPYISFGDASFSKSARATSTQMFVDVMHNYLESLYPTCTGTPLACLRTIGTTENIPLTTNIPAIEMVDGYLGECPFCFNPLWYVAAYTPNFFAFGTTGIYSQFSGDNSGGVSDFPGGVGPMELLSQTWMWWWPVVDGFLITEAPSAAFGISNQDINVIVGQNENEVITFYPGGTNLPAAYTNPNGPPAPFGSADNLFTENTMPIDASNGYGGNPNSNDYNLMGDRAYNVASNLLPHTATLGEIYAKTLEIYNSDAYNAGYSALYGSIDTPITKAIQTVTDGILSKTTKGIVDALTSSGPRTGKVYRYLFAQGGPDWFAARKPGWGACHGCELTYILGLYEMGYTYPIIANYLTEVGSDGSAPSTTVEWTPAEYQVGTAMKAYWGNFFKTGDPNDPGNPDRRRLQAGLPVWQPATAADMNVMVFNEGYAAGAELNPCVMTTDCARVPAKDWKIAESTFWETGLNSVANPVCTAEATNVMALKFTAETFACRVIAFDDPHFLVGHGDRFDYKGKDMTVYNLLSHTNVSVNALFTHADFVASSKEVQRLVHGSFMRELYATVKTNTSRLLTVEFSVYTSAVVRVSADGSPAAMVRPGQVKRFDDVQVELAGRTAKITTPEWVVDAKSKVKPSIVGATKCADGRCTLNVAVSPRFDTANTRVAPHGLMGQSYDGDSVAVIGAVDKYKGDEVSTSAMGEGAIEGVAKDYEMADKFGTRFAFSRFGKASAAPRNVSALSGMKVKANPASVEAKAADDVFVD